MNIQLNADDIDKFVKEALIKSSIGATVQAALDEVINGYNSPLKKELERVISLYAGQIIHERFSVTIKEQLSNYLEKALTADLCDKVVAGVVTKMIEKVNRYD